MTNDSYRFFGWMIPILCMTASAAVVVRQHQNLGHAQSIREEAMRERQSALLDKATVESQATERRYAAADANDLEQTLFLSDLRSRASRSGAVINSWTSQAAEYGKTGPSSSNTVAATPADPKAAELLSGITRVSSTLALTGPYGAIRQFVGDLSQTDRLFTLSHVIWTRDKECTNLIVTLSRYVAPPKASTPTPNESAPIRKNP